MHLPFEAHTTARMYNVNLCPGLRSRPLCAVETLLRDACWNFILTTSILILSRNSYTQLQLTASY